MSMSEFFVTNFRVNSQAMTARQLLSIAMQTILKDVFSES